MNPSRKRRRLTARNGRPQPQPGSSAAPSTHATNPRAQRKTRNGERRMHRDHDGR